MASTPTTAHSPTEHAGTSNVPLAAAGLALAMLLSVLDQAIVATALPQIAADLGGLGSISWVATSYVLGSTATAMLYGRVSDRYGRRATLLAAIAVFTAASALCGLAASLGQLIAFRALQGVGAGALFVVPAIALSELFPPQQRGRAQGYLGAVFALGSVGSPLAGGMLTDALSWRWIFYINLPLGLLAMFLVGTALRLPRGGLRPRLDVAGSALVAAAAVGVMLIAEWGGRDYGWTSARIVSLGFGVVAVLAAFGWWERRAAHPVLPVRLLARPAVRVALAASALLGALLYGAIFFLPTYFQQVHGMNATEAGVALYPAVISLVVASAVAGRLMSATGRPKPILAVGAVAAAVGYVLLSVLGTDSGYGLVAADIAVFGLGAGLMLQLLVVVAQNGVEPSDMAVATSAVMSVRGIGMALGASFFGSVLARRLVTLQPPPDPVAVAVPDMFAWGIPLAFVLVVVVLTLPGRTARTAHTSGSMG